MEKIPDFFDNLGRVKIKRHLSQRCRTLFRMLSPAIIFSMSLCVTEIAILSSSRL